MLLQDQLSLSALVIATFFGLFALIFSIVSLVQSFDDCKRQSCQEDAMFYLSYQMLGLYHFIQLNRNRTLDYINGPVFTQQLCDIIYAIRQCTKLRLWEEIAGVQNDCFYLVLDKLLQAEQKIELSRQKDWNALNNVFNDINDFDLFNFNFITLLQNVYNYNNKICQNYKARRLVPFQILKKFFYIRTSTESYEYILNEMENRGIRLNER